MTKTSPQIKKATIWHILITASVSGSMNPIIPVIIQKAARIKVSIFITVTLEIFLSGKTGKLPSSLSLYSSFFWHRGQAFFCPCILTLHFGQYCIFRLSFPGIKVVARNLHVYAHSAYDPEEIHHNAMGQIGTYLSENHPVPEG